MRKFVLAFICFVWSTLSCAQGVPTAHEWKSIFEEVQQHPLFRTLKVGFSVAAASMQNSPLVVMQTDGFDCGVSIVDDSNAMMSDVLEVGLPVQSSAQTRHALLQAIAAHELGHCLRVRSGELSARNTWSLLAKTEEGSAARHALELKISREEAFADAYALVVTQDSRPELFDDVFAAMSRLRYEPDFQSPFYQLAPLYQYISAHGIKSRLPTKRHIGALLSDAGY